MFTVVYNIKTFGVMIDTIQGTRAFMQASSLPLMLLSQTDRLMGLKGSCVQDACKYCLIMAT